MKKIIIFILLIIAIGISVAVILDYKPLVVKKDPSNPVSIVNVIKLKLQDFQVFIKSSGVANPLTSINLISQVQGKVLFVSSDFKEGKFIPKGQILLKIEDINYQSLLANAKYSLASANLALLEEQARAKRAKYEFSLNKKNKPATILLLRKPHLKKALANLNAAKLKLKKAKIDLSHTIIRMPFKGKIEQKKISLGQFISPGFNFGKVYATDVAEIKIPISNYNLQFMDFFDFNKKQKNLSVELSYLLGETKNIWVGKITRILPKIDAKTQQTFFVAEVKEPYNYKKHVYPLKAGLFVQAKIKGKILKKVIIVPVAAVYRGNEVLIVKDNLMLRKKVNIVFSNSKIAAINKGLSENDLFIINPFANGVTGIRVKINMIKNEF